MGWRERLQPASFRGVPFEVENSDISFGRRAAVHEYPEKDGAKIDDLGRRSRVFSLDLFVVGDDHDLAAQRLHAVLEDKQPGDLVLPWDGRTYVKALDGHKRNASRALGMTVFEVTFQEVDNQPLRPVDDPGRQLQSTADTTSAAATAELTEEVVYAGVPQFVRDGTGNGLAAVAAVFAGLHYAQDLTSDVEAATAAVNALQGNVAALLTAPADLAATVLRAMDSIRATAATSIDGFYAYDVFFDLELPARTGRSNLAAQANRNQQLVLDTAMIGAAYGAALEAIEAQWLTAAAFEGGQARVFAAIDDLQARAGDDLFRALAELRARFVRALDGVQPRARRERSFILPRTTPALLLAYRAFDDIEREAEIVAAGNVRDPLMVPGGVPLTVLLDA